MTNKTSLADTERNNVNYRNKFKSKRYCLNCKKDTLHTVEHIAIHGIETCCICGDSRDEDWANIR